MYMHKGIREIIITLSTAYNNEEARKWAAIEVCVCWHMSYIDL